MSENKLTKEDLLKRLQDSASNKSNNLVNSIFVKQGKHVVRFFMLEDSSKIFSTFYCRGNSFNGFRDNHFYKEEEAAEVNPDDKFFQLDTIVKQLPRDGAMKYAKKKLYVFYAYIIETSIANDDYFKPGKVCILAGGKWFGEQIEQFLKEEIEESPDNILSMLDPTQETNFAVRLSVSKNSDNKNMCMSKLLSNVKSPAIPTEELEKLLPIDEAFLPLKPDEDRVDEMLENAKRDLAQLKGVDESSAKTLKDKKAKEAKVEKPKAEAKTAKVDTIDDADDDTGWGDNGDDDEIPF